MATMDELAANISKTMLQAQRDLSNQDQVLFGSGDVQVTKQDGTRVTVASWSKILPSLNATYPYQKNALTGNLNEVNGDSAGVYFQPANAGALTSLNYPVPYAGSLQVLKNGANGQKSCTQLYYPFTEAAGYIRSGNYAANATTGTWSAWRKIITENPIYSWVTTTIADSVPPISKDLNGWTRTGDYNIYSMNTTNGGLNIPAGAGAFGNLHVSGSGTLDNGFVTQTYTDKGTGIQYTRTRNDGQKAWTGWREKVSTPAGQASTMTSGSTVVVTSGTGAAAGKATINHGLGVVPVTVIVTNGDTEASGNQGKWLVGVAGNSATSFTVKVIDVTTGNGYNGNVRINWIAIA